MGVVQVFLSRNQSKAAVNVAVREFEHFAATRVRRNAANSSRMTGNIVAARFTHETSRSLDPHLRAHLGGAASPVLMCPSFGGSQSGHQPRRQAASRKDGSTDAVVGGCAAAGVRGPRAHAVLFLRFRLFEGW